MKRRLGFLMLCALVSTSVFAISIVNESEATQYFFVSERAPEEIRATISDQRELEEFVQSNMFRTRYVPPGSVRANVSVPAEGGTLVVLHVVPGSADYTVSLHAVRGGNAEIAPSGSGEARVAEVQALDIRLPRAAIRIDNRYVDWEAISPAASFSDATAPERFTREVPDGKESLPISDSLSWGKSGTQLDSVKSVLGDTELFFFASATTEFGERTSIFLYAYEDRGSSRPVFTLEVPLGSATNAVLLWRPGRETPRVVGDFAQAGFLVEARVFLNSLPGGSSFIGLEDASFDLATAYHLPNRFEEFFHATMYVSEIPRRGAGM
jgi:hypothetical protein